MTEEKKQNMKNETEPKADTQSQSDEKNQKPRRLYTIQEVTAAFLIIFLISILFNTDSLHTWVTRLNVGLVRDFFQSAITPLEEFSDKFNFASPARALKKGFRHLARIESEAGWLAANLEEKGFEEVIVTPPPFITPAPEKTPRILYTEERPLRVLLLGDSMVAEALSTSFGRTVQENPFVYYEKKARYSSGMSRPDYYNWPAQLAEIYAEKTFDLVVVMLGMNDAQDFEDNGKVYHYGTEGWFGIYRERVRAFAEQILTKARKLYWLGPPPMRMERYHQRMMALNGIYQEVCQSVENAYFIPTTNILGNENLLYSDYLKINDKLVKVRSSDGKHFTVDGAHLVVNKIMNTLYGDFQFLELRMDPKGLTFQKNAPPKEVLESLKQKASTELSRQENTALPDAVPLAGSNPAG